MMKEMIMNKKEELIIDKDRQESCYEFPSTWDLVIAKRSEYWKEKILGV